MERVTASNYRRIAPLIEHDLPLYVSPPSTATRNWATPRAWPTLNLGNREPFGSLGPEVIGQRGTASEPYAVDELRNHGPTNSTPATARCGPSASGPTRSEISPSSPAAASTGWARAADAGVDALVTGEGKQKAFHEAREAGLNVVMAGHYATETFGVQSLQSLVERGPGDDVSRLPDGL